jgi:hypothetical protein
MSIFDETPETKDFEEKVAIRKSQLLALKTKKETVATKNKLLIMGESQKTCVKCGAPSGNYRMCRNCYFMIKHANAKKRGMGYY